MNICLFSQSQFLPGLAGLGSYACWAIQSLRARGHRVLCISRAAEPAAGDAPVQAVYLNAAAGSFQERMTALLREHEIELLWMQTLSPADVLACRCACDKVGAKLVCHLHVCPTSVIQGYTDCLAADWFDCCRGRRVGAFIYALIRYPLGYLKRCYTERKRLRFLYEQADALVVLSEHYRGEFCRVVGLKTAPKLCALSNPLVKTPGAGLSEKRKEVLYVGRLPWQHKRVDRLLKAWYLLEKDFPDWQLTIVGEGPAQPRYEELKAELGLQHVVFEGRQTPDTFYARASIFCMTSTCEGAPLVIPEAQAAGCVPVVFDSFASVHDVIEAGVNGCLVKPFDIKAYAEKLRCLMSDEPLRASMEGAARRSVARFSSEVIIGQVEALFEELTSQR